MSSELALMDASAYWRLGGPALDRRRFAELDERITRGLVARSTPFQLEIHSGRQLPPVDVEDLPHLWISERAERRAVDLQSQMRAAHQHLGIPPVDYLTVAIAEDHRASVLHYDADFDRIAAHTDLQTALEPLSPLGTLD